MALAKRYHCIFQDRTGTNVELQLWNDGHVGGSTSFMLGKEGLEREDGLNGHDEFEPIKAATVSARVLTTAVMDAIYADTTAWQVRIIDGGTEDFRGPLIREARVQTKNSHGTERNQIRAICGLGDLAHTTFIDATTADGIAEADQKTVVGWWVWILDKVGLSLPIYTASDLFALGMNNDETPADPWSQVYLPARAWLADGDSSRTLLDVLVDLCEPRGMQVSQRAGEWRIYQRSLFSASAFTRYEYASGSAGTSSGTASSFSARATISNPLLKGSADLAQAGYASAVVRYDHGTVDNLIPNTAFDPPTPGASTATGWTISGSSTYVLRGPGTIYRGGRRPEDRAIWRVLRVPGVSITSETVENDVPGLLDTAAQTVTQATPTQFESDGITGFSLNVSAFTEISDAALDLAGTETFRTYAYLQVKLQVGATTYWLSRARRKSASTWETSKSRVQIEIIAGEESTAQITTPAPPGDGTIQVIYEGGATFPLPSIGLNPMTSIYWSPTLSIVPIIDEGDHGATQVITTVSGETGLRRDPILAMNGTGPTAIHPGAMRKSDGTLWQDWQHGSVPTVATGLTMEKAVGRMLLDQTFESVNLVDLRIRRQAVHTSLAFQDSGSTFLPIYSRHNYKTRETQTVAAEVKDDGVTVAYDVLEDVAQGSFRASHNEGASVVVDRLIAEANRITAIVEGVGFQIGTVGQDYGTAEAEAATTTVVIDNLAADLLVGDVLHAENSETGKLYALTVAAAATAGSEVTVTIESATVHLDDGDPVKPGILAGLRIELDGITVAGPYMRSTTFDGVIDPITAEITNAGTVGWAFTKYGDAAFNDVTIRGALDVGTIIGNLTVTTGSVLVGTDVELSSDGLDYKIPSSPTAVTQIRWMWTLGTPLAGTDVNLGAWFAAPTGGVLEVQADRILLDTTGFAGSNQGIYHGTNRVIHKGDSIGALADVDVTTTAPTTNDVLKYDGSNWVPAAGAGSGTDADTLDGFSSEQFLRSDVDDSFTAAELTLAYSSNLVFTTAGGSTYANLYFEAGTDSLAIKRAGGAGVVSFNAATQGIQAYGPVSGITTLNTTGNAHFGAAGSSVARLYARSSGATGATEGLRLENSDQTKFLVWQGDGQLGINTTSPSYEIDVTGTGRFTGAVTMAGLTATTGAFSGLVTATLGVTTPQYLELTGNGATGAGRIRKSTADGLTIQGATGTSYDFRIYGATGSPIMSVGTGTVNADFAGNLTGSGTIGTSGSRWSAGYFTALNLSGAIDVGDGSAAAPSYTFAADQDTGLFRPTTNTIDVSLGGTAYYRFGNAALIPLVAGKTLGESASANRWGTIYGTSLNIDTASGNSIDLYSGATWYGEIKSSSGFTIMSRPSTNLRLSTGGGAHYWTMTTAGALTTPGTVTIGSKLITGSSSWASMSAGQIYHDGTSGLVLVGRTGTTADVGAYTPGGGTVWRNPTGTNDLEIAGTAFPSGSGTVDLGKSGNRWRAVYAVDFNISGALDVGDGTAADPSLTFSSDPDTGFFRVASGAIGVTLNGTHNYTFGNAAFVPIVSTLDLGESGNRWDTVYATDLNASSGAVIGATTETAHGSYDDLIVGSSSHSGITIFSGTAHIGAIQFGDATASNVQGSVGYDHSNEWLYFRAGNTNIGQWSTTGLRLGDGSAPTATLDVAGSLTASGAGSIENLSVGQQGHGTGWLGIRHASTATNTTDYAVLQDSNGETRINAASGQSVNIRNANGTQVAGFAASLITLSKNTTLSGGLQITGTYVPASGTGIELAHDGNAGEITSFDRSLSAWKSLRMRGSDIILAPQGSTMLTATTTAVSVAGDLTVNGQYLTVSHASGPIVRLSRDDVNDYRFDLEADGTDLRFVARDSGGFAFDTLTAVYPVGTSVDLGTSSNRFDVLYANTINLTGTIDFGDGSAAAPSIAFASDTDTGFFRVTSGAIGVTLNGVHNYTLGTAAFVPIVSTLDLGESGNRWDGVYAATGDFSGALTVSGDLTIGSAFFVDESLSRVGVQDAANAPGYPFHVYANTGTLARFERHTSADGFVDISLAGADPQIIFDPGVGTTWAVGVDDGDGDKFKIVASATVEAATARFSMTTGGDATFAATVAVDQTLTVTGALRTNDSLLVDGYTDLLWQSADPGTPAAGKFRIWHQTDGKVYFHSSGGVDVLTLDDGGLVTANSLTVTGATTLSSSLSVVNSGISAYAMSVRRSATGTSFPDIYGDAGYEGVVIGYNSSGTELQVNSGNVNINGGLNVNGTQVITIGRALQNITSASISGALTTTGRITAGQEIVLGTLNSAVAGSIYKTATSGVTIYGAAGTSVDFNLVNSAAATVLQVPTATTTARFHGMVEPDSDNAIDLGHSSRRWRAVYLVDLNLSGAIDVGDGSAAAPSYAFTNDTDTGLFRVTSGAVGVSLNGVHNYTFGTAAFVPIVSTLDLGESGNAWDSLYATNYYGASSTRFMEVQAGHIADAIQVKSSTTELNASGAVRLKEGGTTILEVDGAKVTVYGHLDPNSAGSQDLGDSTLRWNYIYGSNLRLEASGSNAVIGSSSGAASFLRIRGADTNYHNAAVILEAYNSTDTRALGLFMWDSGGQNEWFIGRPYSGSDRIEINRRTGATSQHTGTADSAYTNTSSLVTVDPTQVLFRNGITAFVVQADSGYIAHGLGSDIRMFHDGTANHVKTYSGNLQVGTTTAASLYLQTNNSSRWYVDSSGHLVPFNNLSYNLGSSGAKIDNVHTQNLYTYGITYHEYGGSVRFKDNASGYVYFEGGTGTVHLKRTAGSSILGFNTADSNVTFGGSIGISGTRVSAGYFVDLNLSGNIDVADGTAAAPSYTFASDADTGLFRVTSGAVGIGLNATHQYTFGNAAFVPITSSLDLGESGNRWDVIYGASLDLSGNATVGGNTYTKGSVVIWNADETATTWLANTGGSYAANLDLDPGGYGAGGFVFTRTSASVGAFTTGTGINVSVGGTITATGAIYGTDLNLTGAIDVGNGAAATPSYTFGSDTDTGFFRVTSGAVGVTLNATHYYTFGTLAFVPITASLDLGETGNKWDNVHANTYYGDGSNLTGVGTMSSFTVAADTGSAGITNGETLGMYGGSGITTSETSDDVTIAVDSTVIRTTSTTSNLDGGGVYAFAQGSAASPGVRFTGDTTTGIYRKSANVLGIAGGGVNTASFGNTSATFHKPLLVEYGNSSAPGIGFSSDADTGITGGLAVIYLNVAGALALGAATDITIYNRHLLPNGDNAKNLGGASNAWANVYADGTITGSAYLSLNSALPHELEVGTAFPILELKKSGTVEIEFDYNGDGNFNGTVTDGLSDARMKTAFRPMEDGLDVIRQVRVGRFRYNSWAPERYQGTESAGVLAQELAQVWSYAVTTRRDGMYTVRYQDLITPTIAAVQDLDVILHELERKLTPKIDRNSAFSTAVLGRMQDVEGRIDRIERMLLDFEPTNVLEGEGEVLADQKADPDSVLIITYRGRRFRVPVEAVGRA